ncbi:UTP--glucose-1-phosphate uridylyltransferase [Mycobacterium frederiksbergense]|uniref:UTP--glucose-1-phosphate uridylyltransferase n=1 Tax=Mycolicibacterium frederiksbergense TaxID=117567 RepID=A0ABT6L1G3_9MYCO|nr:UTP--glucose-1-phosphate uridylyltransferase [Mycolicibacterium frederiksbergense]MDH6195830.1 UTP--glucose-1-phosphate uridylyltransferase [Mycolicibacterium frederiksbergense]
MPNELSLQKRDGDGLSCPNYGSSNQNWEMDRLLDAPNSVPIDTLDEMRTDATMPASSKFAEGLAAAQRKMRDAGVPEQAVKVFSAFYHQLEHGASGLIPESEIEPLADLPHIDHLDFDTETLRNAAASTVVIKLNGGLGTTMGMEQAKSLLPVKNGRRFLDLIVDQVARVRRQYDVTLPLIFMNSFRTSRDTLEALAAYPDLAVDGIPLEFLQNREPKLTVGDLEPIAWPADPELEWCPPGHADLYTALDASGVLDQLIEAGYRYASISNADNLGAVPDPAMMAWFAATGAPYAAEVCRRTPADVKGGHLVVRRSDGRLLLRESAQVSPECAASASDLSIHRYFNTNNLWVDLRALRRELDACGGVLSLPLIRNEKNVDPNDPDSPRIIQIESAVGAAISVFEGSTAIEVDRSRFLPVKTTNDLMLIRSDVYRVGSDHQLHTALEDVPAVNLDPRYFARISDFEARVPFPPSLVDAASFTVLGDWSFGEDIVVRGDVVLDDRGESCDIESGTTLTDG